MRQTKLQQLAATATVFALAAAQQATAQDDTYTPSTSSLAYIIAGSSLAAIIGLGCIGVACCKKGRFFAESNNQNNALGQSLIEGENNTAAAGSTQTSPRDNNADNDVKVSIPSVNSQESMNTIDKNIRNTTSDHKAPSAKATL